MRKKSFRPALFILFCHITPKVKNLDTVCIEICIQLIPCLCFLPAQKGWNIQVISSKIFYIKFFYKFLLFFFLAAFLSSKPVAITVTCTSSSKLSSITAPKIILASGSATSWITRAASLAS